MRNCLKPSSKEDVRACSTRRAREILSSWASRADVNECWPLLVEPWQMLAPDFGEACPNLVDIGPT